MKDMQNETWEMYNEKRLKDDFNHVSNLTAVCRNKSSWPGEEYAELVVGETYKVTYIGVFRSRTDIMLEGFGYKDYNSACFDLFENGEPLGRDYVKDFRFLAPYLKERIRLFNPAVYTERQKGVAIISHLHSIEKECDIKVLFAVQTGGRALGLDGPDSDWDVSYLYVHKSEWYGRPQTSHAIKRVFDDDVDTYGWELKDALSSLIEGNQAIFEWLDSPNPYIVKAPVYRKLNEIKRFHFNPDMAFCYYHQVFCSFNDRFLKDGNCLKEFLYFLRGVLACKWVEAKGTIPPLDYAYLLDNTVDDESIRSKVKSLISIKRTGKDVKIETDLIEIVRQMAKRYDGITATPKKDSNVEFSDDLDVFFQDIVKQFN